MQIFKKIISTILVLTMVFSLTACSGIKNKKFGVSFDLKQEPKNLDPQASADNASLIIINNTMEGLLALDNNGKIQKATASSYEMSPDKLTYTFTINKDAKWANGEKVTAKDFLFTFQRLLLKTTNSPYSKLFFCIKNAKLAFDNPEKMSQLGVTAPSNDKLIINLSSPSDNFLKLLTMPCAVACNQKYFESTRGKYGLEANTTIANGAFTVDSWQHKKSIRLTKNDEYYAKKDVKVSFVSLFIDTTIRKINQSQPTSSSTSSKPNKNEEPLQDNTADRLTDGDTLSAMIDGFNDNQLDEKNFKKYEVKNSTWGIAFNFNNKLIANTNLRNAIALAFDKKSYESKLNKNLSVANAIVPPGVMTKISDNKSYRNYAGENLTKMYNPQKAYTTFQQAISQLKTDKIINKNQIGGLNLIVPKIPNVDLAEHFLYPSQILQRDLGIFINVKVLSQNDYQSALKTGDYDCAIVDLVASDNTPRSVLSQFKTGSKQNFYGYSNVNVDKMLENADMQTSESEIMKTFSNIEKLLIDETVFIPMYYKTDYFVTSSIIDKLEYSKFTGLISFKNAVKVK